MCTSLFRIIILLVFCTCAANAQTLKPIFDPGEYFDMLLRCARQSDKPFENDIPAIVSEYKRVYRSPEVGLHNKWELWLHKNNTIAIINIRGTTADQDSWLENFYSAMIPAVGELKLTNTNTFHYKFAAIPGAAVHVGWAIGIGSMAPTMVEQLKKYAALGVKQLVIEGHSQGGALSFLLTSYLHYEMDAGRLPHMDIKTYCSAPPKPGNTCYAYDFDNITRGGWAYSVVNTADWVPETPFAIQTLSDVNKVNPFVNVKDALRKQNLLVRMYGMHVYRQMSRSVRKADHKFQRHLGRQVSKEVRKYLPEFEPPIYTGGFNYVRAGTPIVLAPDADYYKRFPDTGSDIFRNHYFESYYFLVKKAYK